MRLCIIGRLGGKELLNDGQTVKTKAVYEALRGCGLTIDTADIYYIKKYIFKFCFDLIRSLFRDKKYIVLLSKNGRRVMFPFLSFMARYLNKDIYHYAIGGRLADEVESGRHSPARLNSFKGNWVESEYLAKRLRDLGVANAICIPNFKNISILPEQELVTRFQEPYSMCTFSRVMREKGITDAVNAVRSVNEELGRTAVTLDVYGPVEAEYQEELDALLAQNSFVRYKGMIPPNDSVEVICQYYMLLFPTFWPGEGMPGTIIDALSAGVPVIARRWAYCDEMLDDGITGYVYDYDQPEKLQEKIKFAIDHADQTVTMRKNCLQVARRYSADEVTQTIRRAMQL